MQHITVKSKSAIGTRVASAAKLGPAFTVNGVYELHCIHITQSLSFPFAKLETCGANVAKNFAQC